MEIIRCASAGTMESSDAYVEIEPCEKGIQINLELKRRKTNDHLQRPAEGRRRQKTIRAQGNQRAQIEHRLHHGQDRGRIQPQEEPHNYPISKIALYDERTRGSGQLLGQL